MKLQILLLLFFISFTIQDEPIQPQQIAMAVGQIVPGKIDPQVSNKKTHPIYIDQI